VAGDDGGVIGQRFMDHVPLPDSRRIVSRRRCQIEKPVLRQQAGRYDDPAAAVDVMQLAGSDTAFVSRELRDRVACVRFHRHRSVALAAGSGDRSRRRDSGTDAGPPRCIWSGEGDGGGKIGELVPGYRPANDTIQVDEQARWPSKKLDLARISERRKSMTE